MAKNENMPATKIPKKGFYVKNYVKFCDLFKVKKKDREKILANGTSGEVYYFSGRHADNYVLFEGQTSWKIIPTCWIPDPNDLKDYFDYCIENPSNVVFPGEEALREEVRKGRREKRKIVYKIQKQRKNRLKQLMCGSD